MKGIVALDIGTSSVRATVCDETGHSLPSDLRPNAPSFHPDGRVEQDPGAWISLVPAVLKCAAERAEQARVSIVAISVTAQRSSVIAVDRSGFALLPAIMWQDRRTAGLAAELASSNRLVFGRTGLKISPVFSALKMLWIRRSRPEVLARTHKLLGIQDYVLHFLTGRFVTDHSLASRTNLLDLERRCWDPELLELFDVDPDRLCDLVPPGSIVGGLEARAAAASGLPSGLPVVSAGGDQQCAALGLGLLSADRAISNTGTGSYLIGHSDRPLIDPGMRVSCNVSALPGSWIVEAILPTSGAVYRWFKDTLWNGAAGADNPYDVLDAEAAQSGVGANGVLLLPHFSGSGTPDWDPDATGIFHGLSLATRRGDLARAILEGIAMELKNGLVVVEELVGPVETVRVSGGMSRSPLFNRIQADCLGKRIIQYKGGEATSIGAWIAGAVATGLAPGYVEAFERATRDCPRTTFDPDENDRALYDRLRAKARVLYDAVSARAVGRTPAAPG